MTDFNLVRVLGDDASAIILDTRTITFPILQDLPRIRMLSTAGGEQLLIEGGRISAREFTIPDRVTIDDAGLSGIIRVQKHGPEPLVTTVRIEGQTGLIVTQNDDEVETIRLEGQSSSLAFKNDDGDATMRLEGSVGQMELRQLQLRDQRNGEISIQMDGLTGNVVLGGAGNDGDLTLTGTDGQTTIDLNGGLGHAVFGGHGKNGKISLEDNLGRTPISLDGRTGNAKLSGDLTLNTITLQGNTGSAILGGNGEDGELTLKNNTNQVTATLDGNTGGITLGGLGQGGDLRLRNKSGQTTLAVNGDAGELSFQTAANCAIDFDVENVAQAEPGTLMVLGDDERLRQSTRPFDKRVVGVVSGAKETQPGIVLDRKSITLARQPIAVMGKVFCKVDATLAPIEVGDLLTTSPTPGHAMKANNPDQAFGAVIGKALSSLRSGRGLMLILVTLQ